MLRVLLSFSLVVLVCAQPAPFPRAQVRQYALPVNGAEILNPSTPPLSYISNLRLDMADPSRPMLWFLADKGAPNLFYAVIDPKGAPRSHFRPFQLILGGSW